jgi:hypothetical protein
VGFEIFPFGVGKIGCVAPLRVSERTSSSYLIRFIRQSLEARLYPFASERDRYAAYPNAPEELIEMLTPCRP